MDVLQAIEIVAPRIIRKVIQKRNYLEHQFACPEKDEIEDFIDVATLFIEASNRVLDIFQAGFTVGDKENMFDDEDHFKHCIYFHFDSDRKEFELRGYKDSVFLEHITITPKDKEYFALLKLAISIRKELNPEDALKSFINLVNK